MMGRPYGTGRIHNYGDVYDFIVRYKRGHDGSSPTIREIMATCDISSTSAVRHVLEALQFEGLVKLHSRARSIEVVGAQWTPPHV